MPFKIFIITALIIVVLSMLAMLIRVILGPSLADRVVALDAIGLQLMAVIALFSILLNIKYMLVVILMVGILAFLGTAVFSKFMDEGKVIKHVYSRAHAAGKAATLGAMFLLFGAFLYFIGTEGYVNMQLIIGIIFVFITGPLSSHLIMKAAYNIKTPYTKDTKIDEIKEDMKHTKL